MGEMWRNGHSPLHFHFTYLQCISFVIAQVQLSLRRYNEIAASITVDAITDDKLNVERKDEKIPVSSKFKHRHQYSTNGLVYEFIIPFEAGVGYLVILRWMSHHNFMLLVTRASESIGTSTVQTVVYVVVFSNHESRGILGILKSMTARKMKTKRFSWQQGA